MLEHLWNRKRIESKQKLAEYRRKIRQGIRVDGELPLGTGPLNRDGMPRLPPGQHEVTKWPVLDLGVHPEISLADWRLEVRGLVERPAVLSWQEFLGLPQTEDVSDFHCVTTWSCFGMRWVGVRFSDLMTHTGLRPEASHVFIRSYDDYTTNLRLEDAMKRDVLLVHQAGGAPLTREHGGPVRMITPRLYAWKGAKWIKTLEIRDYDELGFWEQRGYSNTAEPWLEDRHAAE